MKLGRRATLLVALLCLAGCRSWADRTVVVPTSPTAAASAAPPQIAILPGTPKKPFRTVALLQAVRNRSDGKQAARAALAALRSDAVRRRCDAISHVVVQSGTNYGAAFGACVVFPRN